MLTSPPNIEATAKTASAARKTRLPAEQVGGAAAEQQQPAVAEHVPAHHPLQRRGGQPQIGPDGRQRDADHGDVERIQEQGAAQHDEQAPQPGLQPWLSP